MAKDRERCPGNTVGIGSSESPVMLLMQMIFPVCSFQGLTWIYWNSQSSSLLGRNDIQKLATEKTCFLAVSVFAILRKKYPTILPGENRSGLALLPSASWGGQ